MLFFLLGDQGLNFFKYEHLFLPFKILRFVKLTISKPPNNSFDRKRFCYWTDTNDLN